jgi:hypothetical protein
VKLCQDVVGQGAVAQMCDHEGGVLALARGVGKLVLAQDRPNNRHNQDVDVGVTVQIPGRWRVGDSSDVIFFRRRGSEGANNFRGA